MKIDKLNEEENLFDILDIDDNSLTEASLGDTIADRQKGIRREWKTEISDDELDEAEKELVHILENPEKAYNPGDIEKTLDSALRQNKRMKRTGSKNFVNVLFIGPAGTGKTSRIKKWAERNNVNLVHVLASTMDDTDLGGAISPNNTGEIVNRLASTEMDELGEVENSVLFLDEYNRAYDSVRGTLLTLIQDHTVPDPRVRGKQRYLENFLFTIAAINPEGDYNVKDLDPAEKTRFRLKNISHDKMNSYGYLKSELARLFDQNNSDPNIDDQERMDFNTEIKRKLNLINTIMPNPEFDFQEADPDSGVFGITSARTFTNLLMSCDGTKRDLLDQWDDFCDPEQKPVIERILRDFKDVKNKANSVFSRNKDQKIQDMGDASFIDLL